MPPKATRGSNSRGPEYSVTECLLVCRSFIYVSKDAVTGTSQNKAHVLHNAVLSRYKMLVEHQEKRETVSEQNLARAKASVTALQGEAAEEEEKRIQEIHVKYPDRTACSVMAKKGYLWRLTEKWVAFEKTHERGTGENTDEEWLNRILPLFETQNGVRFEKYIPISNYLRRQAPFIGYVNPMNGSVGTNNQQQGTQQKEERPRRTKKEKKMRKIEKQRKKARMERNAHDLWLIREVSAAIVAPAVARNNKMGEALKSIADSYQMSFLFHHMTTDQKNEYMEAMHELEMRRADAEMASAARL